MGMGPAPLPRLYVFGGAWPHDLPGGRRRGLDSRRRCRDLRGRGGATVLKVGGERGWRGGGKGSAKGRKSSKLWGWFIGISIMTN
jgi:hypothetical protein